MGPPTHASMEESGDKKKIRCLPCFSHSSPLPLTSPPLLMMTIKKSQLIFAVNAPFGHLFCESPLKMYLLCCGGLCKNCMPGLRCTNKLPSREPRTPQTPQTKSSSSCPSSSIPVAVHRAWKEKIYRV